MVRSNFAITRLIVLPYAVLLVLYLAVIGGGGALLWHQFRAVETRLLISKTMAELKPLAQRLRSGDAIAAMRDSEAWLVTDVERLFSGMSALRDVSVRGPETGYRIASDAAGAVSTYMIPPLPEDARRAEFDRLPIERLHEEATSQFSISFDMSEPAKPLVRLEFAFDRAMLLASIDDGMATIRQSILLFGMVGALSILIALVITGVAMHTTRRLESYFQEIYQRASLTETAAQLVHDLRNPLAALRANVKALVVSPQETSQIVAELDQDIVTLNNKLSAFLNMTRQREEAVAPIDLAELIDNAVRLAEPVLVKRGLTLETDIAPDLPRPYWQAAFMRDALLNLILNAAQSGQREGIIRITAQAREGELEITVEDRGKGIACEQMPHLFDAFYTTREDGNGLGLAIVRRIVAHHQGHVHAENRPGGGARFVLTLPLQRKEIPHWWNRLKKPFRI